MITPEEIIQIVVELSEASSEQNSLEPDTALVGPKSSIDSMGLVQLCLALEEKADSLGFDFDWTSEKAMSSMNSLFLLTVSA